MKKILIFNRNEKLTFTYLMQKQNQNLKDFEFLIICEKPIENSKFRALLSGKESRYSVHQYDYSFKDFYEAMSILNSTVVIEKIVFAQPEIANQTSADLETLKIVDLEATLCSYLLKPTLAIGYLLPMLTRSSSPEIRILMPSFRGCSFNYIYSCTKQALQMYFSSLQIEYPMLNLKIQESHESNPRSYRNLKPCVLDSINK